MRPADLLKRTPWDSAIYGVETYEIQRVSEEVLSQAAATPGHYTAKVAPLESKQLLHAFGFYYCDTLIEPYCEARSLVRHPRDDVGVSREVGIDELLAVGHGAFAFDRFHRDFNLDPADADTRYDNWLRQLHRDGQAYGLFLGGNLAGFICLSGHRMVLHAVAQPCRGKGIAKYLWSAACAYFFEELGLDVIDSSVSAANLPVLNLYASLGFRFRNGVDVYHLLVDGDTAP